MVVLVYLDIVLFSMSGQGWEPRDDHPVSAETTDAGREHGVNSSLQDLGNLGSVIG